MSLQDKMNVSAKPALKSLKTEVANELGLADYEQADKGNLTARQNGYVGEMCIRDRSEGLRCGSVFPAKVSPHRGG